jgi:crossover junction endodeoxyribonuclease RuvC
MRVLGIDPSSQSTGFGIIEHTDNQYIVQAFGTIKPSRRLPLHEKLNEIKERLEELIKAYAPEDVAIENPFYAQNIKTALVLGQVRGAVLVAVASSRCSLFEYSALEIKKAVTGYGQAEKQQVSTMVRALLNIEDDFLEPDASDALAAAYCHLNTRLFQQKVEESTSRGRQ